MNLTLIERTLILFLLSISIFACKKEGNVPAIENISPSTEKIAVGQYIVLKSAIAGEAAQLTYKWTSSDGLQSANKEPGWIPKKAGYQTISLEIAQGNKSTTKNAVFNVLDPDFRLGLWGNTRAEIQLYESKAGRKLLNTDPAVLIYGGDDGNAFDGYVTADNILINAATLYSVDYSSNPSLYVRDYSLQLQKLQSKYGDPKENRVYYKNQTVQDELDANPGLVGSAILAGDVRFKATWEKQGNSINLMLYKNTDSNAIVFGISYAPLSTGVASVKNEHRSVVLERLHRSLLLL